MIHDVNIGIELASEHAGRSTRNVTVTQQPGLRLDGDRDRDRRLRPPPREHRGLRHRQQHDREHRRRRAARAVRHAGQPDREQRDRRRPARTSSSRTPYRENVGNVLDHNLYFSVDGSSDGHLDCGRASATTTSTRGASGRGTTRTRPSPTPGSSTRRRTTTPSERARPPSTPGRSWPRPGSTDLAGEPRAQAGGIDLGAFETGRASALPDPFDPGAGDLRRRPHVGRRTQRVGAAGGRSEQRGACARRRRADP